MVTTLVDAGHFMLAGFIRNVIDSRRNMHGESAGWKTDKLESIRTFKIQS